MGLHTGEPTPYEDGYVGMDVHRAARVAAIAHGGQVVLTDTTAALVRGSLPEGARLSDLGEHRLKDLSTPEHLFQLWGPGDDEVFPPVRSLGTTSSLPQPRTTLVGRDTDRARLMAMLSEPDIRLVTLTGPGGTGKTRLAVDVANHLADAHPDGVYFVPLAAVTTSDALWATLADRLDLTDDRTAEHVLERVSTTSVCSSCSTTSSSCRRLPTPWPRCWPVPRDCGSWRPRVAPCTSAASTSTPCPRWRSR